MSTNIDTNIDIFRASSLIVQSRNPETKKALKTRLPRRAFINDRQHAERNRRQTWLKRKSHAENARQTTGLTLTKQRPAKNVEHLLKAQKRSKVRSDS